MSAIKSLTTKDSLWTGITAGVNTFKELIQVTNQKKKKKKKKNQQNYQILSGKEGKKM